MKRMLCCTMLVLVFALLVSSVKADKSVRITFVGDVTLGSEERLWEEGFSLVSFAKENGYAYFFENVKPLFEKDDLTVINLEGVLSDSAEDENTGKTYRFRGPTSFAQILTEGSVEAVNLANNHTLDYGERGYRDTVTALDAVGIAHFGYRDEYIWEKDGVRLAFLGMSYTDAGREEQDWMESEIARLEREEGVSAVIFTYHGGQEYGEARTKKQAQIARRAIDAGADLVIMHHAHVVQGMSVLNNRSVLYSLGNFCFGGNKNVRAMESLAAVAELTFSDDGTYVGQQIELYPANISGTEGKNNYQPRLVTGQAARRAIRRVQADTRFKLNALDEERGIVRQDFLPAT